MKIIITDKMDEEGIRYLSERGYQADAKFGMPRDELLKIMGDYDAIIVRSTTRVDRELLEHAPNLKVACRAGNGIDNIDVDECTKRGIAVTNTPEGNTMAAAELSVALIFALFRNIPQAYAAARQKDFRRNKFMGTELDGKAAGVVGLGRIGTIVATRLKACGMTVYGFDPYVTEDRMAELGFVKCEKLDDLMAVADVISVHIPMTAGSRNLIGERELGLCKKGTRIVNVARGGIIDENALYEAIKSGHIAGAAIDTLKEEPDFSLKPEAQTYSNPLLELDNVIITPHLGASTTEANKNVSLQAAKLVDSVLRGEPVAALNMPLLKNTDLTKLRPYLDLAEMLGGIYYRTEKDTVTSMEIIYEGGLTAMDTGLITLSAMIGFLGTFITENNINFINAALFMKNAGVKVTESKSSDTGLSKDMITVRFVTKKRNFSVSGTVYAGDEIRITDFFGYKMDFEPTRYVLAVRNTDQPGVIGNIGMLLGSSGINIGSMQWTRNHKGDKAMAFISTDVETPEDVLCKIKKIDGVLNASSIIFEKGPQG